jgi:hypothetical protein
VTNIRIHHASDFILFLSTTKMLQLKKISANASNFHDKGNLHKPTTITDPQIQ